MFRCQDLRTFGLDFAVANSHLVHAVHQLRDQIEIETRTAEGRDLALRRHDHSSIFKRVVEIVAGHDNGKLWCPMLFSKHAGKTIRTHTTEILSSAKANWATYFFACCCSPAVCCP